MMPASSLPRPLRLLGLVCVLVCAALLFGGMHMHTHSTAAEQAPAAAQRMRRSVDPGPLLLAPQAGTPTSTSLPASSLPRAAVPGAAAAAAAVAGAGTDASVQPAPQGAAAASAASAASAAPASPFSIDPARWRVINITAPDGTVIPNYTGCTDHNRATRCIDPEVECNALKLPDSRAFAFVHDLQKPLSNATVKGFVDSALNLILLHPHTRVVLVTPPPAEAEAPLSAEHTAQLEAAGIALVHRSLPRVSKELKHIAEHSGNCCGWRGFFKLVVFTLDRFEAVIFLDTDVEVHNTLDELFRCTNRWQLLSTSGHMSGLNSGMLVLRPSMKTYNQMQKMIEQPDAYTRSTGWFNKHYPQTPSMRIPTFGAETPQGFLYYFFHQQPAEPSSDDDRIAVQISRCKYSYLHESSSLSHEMCPDWLFPSIVHKYEPSHAPRLQPIYRLSSQFRLRAALLSGLDSQLPGTGRSPADISRTRWVGNAHMTARARARAQRIAAGGSRDDDDAPGDEASLEDDSDRKTSQV